MPTPSEDLKRAIDLHQAGRFQEAEAIYAKLDQSNPDILQIYGVLLFQTGRQELGIQKLESALEIAPKHLEALANLGVVQYELGRFLEASQLFERVLAIDPTNVDALNKRGFTLQDLGRHGEAARSFEQALELVPGYWEGWFNLGNSRRELGDMPEAEKVFRTAVRIRPDYYDAWTNLSSVLYLQRQFDEAMQSARRSLALRPTAEGYHNLANALSALGRTEEALSAVKVATQLEPKNAGHYHIHGMMLQANRRLPEALENYRKAASLDPGNPKIMVRLGTALNQDGRFEEALEALGSIPKPPDGMRIAKALLFPPIPESRQQIEECRDRVRHEISALLNQELRVEDPTKEISLTNFYWSYHSEGELDMQRMAVELYERSCPTLRWESPGLDKRRKGKIRLGVVSAFLHRHTIGKLFIRLIAGLRNQEVEVVYFDCARNMDDWTVELNSKVDEAYKLIPELGPSREFIAEQNLDALFFPEIGMDPFTYYLAYSRMAPLQFMTWGHPVSTALPTIDCFLSSKALESPGSEEQYSERLVQFDDLMTVFTRPDMPTSTCADLGVPEDRHLYVCAQSLFKLHPDFDLALGEILRRDPKGMVVHLTGNEKHWDELVMSRYRKTIPDVADRIQILGRLTLEKFLALHQTADAVLDTFYFGGGNSSLEAFSVGAPIVTLPSHMLRGRITKAQYDAMAMTDLVASSSEDFVERAVRLANDREWHRSLSKTILDRCPKLFDNEQPITELRDWLLNEVRR